MPLPLSATRRKAVLRPSIFVTCARGKRAVTPKTFPVRRWQSMQWQIAIRTGSPSQVRRSCPQQQWASRVGMATSENLEGARRGRLRRRRGADGPADELRLEAGDPAMSAIVELEVLGHQPATGDEDAEIGTLVAEISGAADAQEEGLALALHGAPVIIEARIGDTPVG